MPDHCFTTTVRGLTSARIDELVAAIEDALLAAHAAGDLATADERDARRLLAAISNRDEAADG